MRIHSAGSGPALVLVHSWATGAGSWDAIVPDLARDHTVVTYDWLGSGDNADVDVPVTIAACAAELVGVCAGLQRPVVVGSSVGSLFALEAARERPDVVGGVIALACPGHHAAALTEQLRRLTHDLGVDRPAAVTAMVDSFYRPGVGAEQRARTVAAILEASPHADALFLEQTTYDPRPWLAGLTVPVTYVAGRLDHLAPVAVAEELAALHGDAVVIEGAGHMIQHETPEELVAVLRRAAVLSS